MIYWFYGDDRVRIAQAVRKLVGEGEQLTVDAELVVPQDFWARLTTVPMFGAAETVVVKDVLKRTDLQQNLIKLVLEGPRKPIILWDETVDKRSKLYKDLVKVVEFREMSLPKGDDKAVFRLLEAALRGDLAGLERDLTAITTGRGMEPVAVAAIVSGQLYNLAAVVCTDEKPDKLAKDLGVHPFALSALLKYRGKITPEKWREMLDVACETDRLLKTASLDNRLLLRQMFYQMSAISSRR
jgi:DNA polymerase III delta subunit